MFMKPTKSANGNIFDIHEDAMDILLYPTDDETPCPWDADIDVQSGKVILIGALGPSGGRGSICRCECAIEDFSRFYKLEVPDNEELISAMEAAGWVED